VRGEAFAVIRPRETLEALMSQESPADL